LYIFVELKQVKQLSKRKEMAKLNSIGKMETTHKSRPGVHSKNNTSRSKTSKNYKKKYRGQGR
jgi:hypothetical protein